MLGWLDCAETGFFSMSIFNAGVNMLRPALRELSGVVSGRGLSLLSSSMITCFERSFELATDGSRLKLNLRW